MLTLIKIACCNTYAKHYQQSLQALNIRSAGYMGAQERNEGRQGGTIPRAPNKYEGAKSLRGR